LSCTHAGNIFGLTPPGADQEDFPWMRKFWDWYIDQLQKIGPVDLLLLLGDHIDGQGRKDNSELFTTDSGRQIDIAKRVIEQVDCIEMRMVRGTPYHTKSCTENEDILAHKLGISIANEYEATIYGKRLDVRHTARKSNSPDGQPSSAWKEVTRKTLLNSKNGEPPPDVVVRGHTHEYYHIEYRNRHVVGVPGLQLPFGTYGRKLFTYNYDVGLVVIDFYDTGHVHAIPALMDISVVRKQEVECLTK